MKIQVTSSELVAIGFMALAARGELDPEIACYSAGVFSVMQVFLRHGIEEVPEDQILACVRDLKADCIPDSGDNSRMIFEQVMTKHLERALSYKAYGKSLQE